MPDRKLIEIDVKVGAFTETQSGFQRMKPRINGAYLEPAGAKRVGLVIMHPSNSMLAHSLLEPLAERGIGALGLGSRFLNNDSTLLMERVIQDLGAGVKFLRSQGYAKVLLAGFSGGAALSCFYQAQAEKLTITHTPAGDAVDLQAADLPPADGIALIAAHAGRSRLFLEWIDGSVTDERDALSCNPTLDIYNSANGAPYSAAFLERYRAAQLSRRDRLEAWVKQRLAYVRSTGLASDEAMIVHRTFADPRFMDLSIDANDRKAGGIWGNARAANYASNSIGRYTTLTAFLSQWASVSQADGPTNVARTTVPVQYIDLTGDASAFPSTRDLWMSAIGRRGHLHAIKGADHYLKNAPHLAEAADVVAEFSRRL